MSFSIIIVHHNAPDQLRSCLASIPPAEEVIVVDNASEAPPADLQIIYPKVQWVLNKKNEGYGAAANRGARLATGKWMVILNQDIELEAGCLDHLTEDIKKQPEIGIWGASLKNKDGSGQPSTGPFPTLTNWLWRLRLPKEERKYYRKRPKPGIAVHWATGAFLCVKHSVWATLGGFDERYFMYYEDTDLCKRADQMGITIARSNAKAIHSSPLAMRGPTKEELAQHIRYSQLRYFRLHRPKWEFLILATITKAYFSKQGWTYAPAYL